MSVMLGMRQFLCMGEKTPGHSHFWGAYDSTDGSKFVDCPEHDGAEESVTTEPLHVHECYGCQGIFTHAEEACEAVPSTYAPFDEPRHDGGRFVCWMCSREGR